MTNKESHETVFLYLWLTTYSETFPTNCICGAFTSEESARQWYKNYGQSHYGDSAELYSIEEGAPWAPDSLKLIAKGGKGILDKV
jgi:hypothetical protein